MKIQNSEMYRTLIVGDELDNHKELDIRIQFDGGADEVNIYLDKDAVEHLIDHLTQLLSK